MKDARYLVRIGQSGTFQPSDQADLLSKARAHVEPLGGKAINLRVSRTAIEFDLFIAPNEDVATFLSALKPLGHVLTCKRLDLPPASVHPSAVVAEARHLFNEQRFWEVHEVLEGLWKELKGSEKELVQGLIIAAAAWVHVQKDEWDPVWKMLADALRRIGREFDTYQGWDIKKFREHLARILADKKIDFPTV